MFRPYLCRQGPLSSSGTASVQEGGGGGGGALEYCAACPPWSWASVAFHDFLIVAVHGTQSVEVAGAPDLPGKCTPRLNHNLKWELCCRCRPSGSCHQVHTWCCCPPRRRPAGRQAQDVRLPHLAGFGNKQRAGGGPSNIAACNVTWRIILYSCSHRSSSSCGAQICLLATHLAKALGRVSVPSLVAPAPRGEAANVFSSARSVECCTN